MGTLNSISFSKISESIIPTTNYLTTKIGKYFHAVTDGHIDSNLNFVAQRAGIVFNFNQLNQHDNDKRVTDYATEAYAKKILIGSKLCYVTCILI